MDNTFEIVDTPTSSAKFCGWRAIADTIRSLPPGKSLRFQVDGEPVRQRNQIYCSLFRYIRVRTIYDKDSNSIFVSRRLDEKQPAEKSDA